MNIEIVNCNFNRKTNITTFNFNVNNKIIPLSFDSNPLLEVEILELHQQLLSSFLNKIQNIIQNESYNYKTLKSLQDFYNIFNNKLNNLT